MTQLIDTCQRAQIQRLSDGLSAAGHAGAFREGRAGIDKMNPTFASLIPLMPWMPSIIFPGEGAVTMHHLPR